MLTANQNRAARSVADLLRESYRDIPLYSTPRGRIDVDLSDNTNLWGPPPAAPRALAAVGQEDVARYPIAFEPALSSALASYAGVSPDMIACGCGSDDVLDSAIRAFAEPGQMLCVPDPSFSMIPVFARTNGLAPVSIPLTPSLEVNVDAILETDARIIYLCSPNNPTGGAIARRTVEQIVENAQGLVIIDQAYVEFGGESYVDLASGGRPVLITRTMSKAFGLAGLRVGYGIGSPELIAEVLKARGPYKVNALAERAAIAALEDDRAWVDNRVNEVIANRSRLRTELGNRGLPSLESSANFILVPVDDCAAISRRLERAGIRVRALPQLAGIGDAIRIAIGPWEMMQQCIDTLATAT
ncbi:MAG: histidinol-phosphate aminotransferase family protein [Gemmatimonadota bacterium]|nr:histidinol-phosphate aminotransferase family protein [Gemmatimonadota bacterium]